jgi:CRISPR-associated endoribonuclease Cas6
VTFNFIACRFQVAARRAIHFPPSMAGNVLRGALGSALRETAGAEVYARIFRPSAAGAGPSGLSDPPRPFVLRCAELNARTVQPGEPFCFGLHLFDTRDSTLDHLTRAFSHWADVISVRQERLTINSKSRSVPVTRVRIVFHTPTELKAKGHIATSDFSVLLARARDRVSTLRALYGEGPLQIDFRGLAARAQAVKTTTRELRPVDVERRSSRTGQRHPIGGLVGFAEYEGDLAEFLPYLEVASWTGVGRHCTWGNGHITTKVLA